MYLIDKTYFTNKYEIEQILEIDSKNAVTLNAYIEDYVVEFLQTLLGAADFTDLNNSIENGALKDDAPQRWKDLVNGCTYDDKFWKGLIYQNGSVKRSLLTAYVYCKIIADLEANNGRAVIQTKNVKVNVMRSQFVSVWNEVASQFLQYSENGILQFVDGVPFYDYYQPAIGDGYVTLSQFLNDKSDVYTKTNLCFIEPINRLDVC